MGVYRPAQKEAIRFSKSLLYLAAALRGKTAPDKDGNTKDVGLHVVDVAVSSVPSGITNPQKLAEDRYRWAGSTCAGPT